MIKKVINFTAKVILVSSILISLLFFCGYKYVEYHLKKSLSTPLHHIESDIHKTKPLPDNILDTFNEMYKTKHVISYINESLFENRSGKYMSEETAQLIIVHYSSGQNRYGFPKLVLAHQLEQQFSDDQLLAFYASNFDFLNNNTGFYSASLHYFDKKLEDLNKREAATLILMLDNPRMYHPHRASALERLNQRLELLGY
ncbi:transglycosylase domain-containing protein [Nonlabens sp. Asnod2-A12]|uniref:transglycosylase domain-containing protein n=1 Tax=Nonlabens sp. Asnod2-A12 TaxID=3160578 RepID=UPI00386F78A7